MVETMRCVLTATSILHSPAPPRGKMVETLGMELSQGRRRGGKKFVLILFSFSLSHSVIN